MDSLSEHIQEYPLGELKPVQFLVIAKEAFARLQWNVTVLEETKIIAYPQILSEERLYRILITFHENSATIECADNKGEDSETNTNNYALFISVFEQVRASLSPEELRTRIDQFKPYNTEQGESTTRKRKPGFKDYLSLLLPGKNSFLTQIIIYSNVLLFLLMVGSGANILNPDSESLLIWGANFRPLTLQGEWWRLLSSCFVHVGILHLVMNMYALLFIGILLERYLGSARFLTAYILSGIVASTTSLVWHDETISAGASGAIFGLFGVFLALLTTNLILKEHRKAQLKNMLFLIAFNLLYGMQSGIDNAAHLGGLISGMIIGYAFIPSIREVDSQRIRYSTISILIVLVLSGAYASYKLLPNDYGEYDTIIEEFSSLDQRSVQVFYSPQFDRAEILSILNNDIIPMMTVAKQRLYLASHLRVSDRLKKHTEKLVQYCELRLKTYELLRQELEGGTNEFDREIEAYNKQIEALIAEMKSN